MTKNGSPQSLPAPNVAVRTSGQTEDFTPEQIRGMVCNPIYAGMGPYPQLIPDEKWIAAASQVIKKEGAEQFLVNLLYVLRETLADDAM